MIGAWRTLAHVRRAMCRSPSVGVAAALCGKPLSDATLATLDDLCRDQLMSMKTTFTPGTYRRRVATVMAKRLVKQLWARAA